MKVIAIDPGFGRCGIAILEKKNGREIYIHSECVETSKSLPFGERLQEVTDTCAALIQKHKPSAIALERLYFNTNQKTAMQVAEVRGAILYIAQRAGIPSFEYTPGQVKSASSGFGRADKKQVAAMLKSLLKIEKTIKHDDEFDAIAVGVTHLAHAR